jgi:hypothetical protein
MYELCLRHAIRKPVVQLIDAGERLPFDVASNRTIIFDYRDMESVDLCKQSLTQQIIAVEKDPSLVDNPISVSIDLQGLKASGDPMAKSSGQIIEMLQNIQAMISKPAVYSWEPSLYSSQMLTAPGDQWATTQTTPGAITAEGSRILSLLLKNRSNEPVSVQPSTHSRIEAAGMRATGERKQPRRKKSND